ncbi:MAG: hypothetical protein LBK96_03260, partial [Prevotellaceae bacterium]|nr:hypothetical protein [Prevotellaceae bacterium]
MIKLLCAWTGGRKLREDGFDSQSYSRIFLIWLHCSFAALFCFAYAETGAQNVSTVEILDTTVTSSDTAAYNRMRQAMSNRKLTQRIFSLLTRRPSDGTAVPAQETSIDEQFIPYSGMTIRDIRVVVLPPVKYDVRKFDSVPEMSRLNKAINSTHANTRRWVLRNSLLFNRGEEIDPLIMAETESFIRNIGYINDVYIRIDTVSQTEANVTVVVQDNLSIGAQVRNVSSKVDIEIFDRNFIGLGNNFSLRGILNTKTDRKFGGGVGYKYPNLLRTFINIDASFVDDILSTYRAASLERPLQKNLNIFGQISLNLREINLSHAVWDSISPTYNDDFSASLGYAFNPTEKDNTFVVSARFRDRNPLYKGVSKPDDPESFQYVRNRMALMQLSLFRQRYFRTSLVNSFGKPENFAYGYNVSAQLGYSEWTQFSKRSVYTSLKVALNKRFPVASVYFEGAVSSFFDRVKPFEGILKLKLNMFSSLYSVGDQSYRHFLTIDYTKRLDFIPGFRNYNISFEKLASMKFRDITNYMATEALMFKTEGNVFSSLNVLGFRFLFYSFADFGWVTRYRHA